MKKDNTANLTWYDHHRNKGSTPHMRKGIVSYCCCHMLGCYSADILGSFFFGSKVPLGLDWDTVTTMYRQLHSQWEWIQELIKRWGREGWGRGGGAGYRHRTETSRMWWLLANPALAVSRTWIWSPSSPNHYMKNMKIASKNSAIKALTGTRSTVHFDYTVICRRIWTILLSAPLWTGATYRGSDKQEVTVMHRS